MQPAANHHARIVFDCRTGKRSGSDVIDDCRAGIGFDLVGRSKVTSLRLICHASGNQVLKRRETMRRISLIIMTIACILTMLSCVSEQAPTTEAPRVGKPLVTRLPAKIEGVEVISGTVRAKSGFKFVKQPNGSVAVAPVGTPGIAAGTWSCDCGPKPSGGAPTGFCGAVISQDVLYCKTDTCSGECHLTVTISGVSKPVIAY